MLGLGVLKSMMTTLSHMLFFRPVTVEYPEQRLELPQWTRGRPRLIYDLDSGDLRCVACHACELACPVEVIKIDEHPGPDGKKKILDRFDIDMGGCIECALCVEACPFRAIVMAPDFEFGTYDRTQSLVFNMHQLRIAGTPEVDQAMEYIQGVKRGLARSGPVPTPAATGAPARPAAAPQPAGAGAPARAAGAPGAVPPRPAAAAGGAPRPAPAATGAPARPTQSAAAEPTDAAPSERPAPPARPAPATPPAERPASVGEAERREPAE